MSKTIYQSHHIIPKHAGGTDDPENLVRLTTAEHAKAHRLLYEKYGRKEDELAWKGLAGMIGKEEMIHAINVMNGKRHKGRKLTPETKEKMSVTRMGKKHSPETKEKIRVAVKKYNAKKYYETL